MSIEIIAEIANAHQGDFNKAIEIGNKAIVSKADAIKFQIYFADEFLVPYHPRYNHFKKQAFTKKQWKIIFNQFKNKKIKIYCDVFGLKAFNFVKKLKIDGIKIHSSDLNNYHLLKACNEFDKKIFLSCGGSTIKEINYAVNILSKHKPILLHGFQSYPTKVEDSNLARIFLFKKIYGNRCDYGYQDHINGSSIFSTILPAISLSFGIKYLEKHITINRSEKGVDYYSSIEPKQFKNFVTNIRKSEENISKKIFNYSQSENNYRKEVKKFWVANSNLSKNKKITKKDLIMKRLNNANLHPIFIEKIEGKKLNKNIKKNQELNKFYLKNNIYALILVRSQSKRLPNKAYLEINNQPIIEHLIQRVKKIQLVNKIILCTTKDKEDDRLVRIAKKNNIQSFRGDTKNVLKRMLDAIKNKNCDSVLRITGDDILVDPTNADLAITHHLRTNAEYTEHKKMPGGTEVEIFDVDLLKRIHSSIIDPDNTEYLTNFITDNQSQINISSAPLEKKYRNKLNLTIDTKEEFLMVKRFLLQMKKENKFLDYNLKDIISFYRNNKNYRIKPKSKLKLSINTKINLKKFH